MHLQAQGLNGLPVLTANRKKPWKMPIVFHYSFFVSQASVVSRFVHIPHINLM